MQVKNLGFPTNNNSLLNVYYLPTVKHLIILYYYIRWKLLLPYPVQFSSVTQLCPTLCDPTNCSMPGLSVHHQLLEFTQTHDHRVGDAIQPSHPLSSPFLTYSLSIERLLLSCERLWDSWHPDERNSVRGQ